MVHTFWIRDVLILLVEFFFVTVRKKIIIVPYNEKDCPTILDRADL